jgi:hypothetical protein
MTVKMTSATAKPATVVSGEQSRCFVCDVTVAGRYYTLATCRTQSTKVRLIEKLGQLVGERYTKDIPYCLFLFSCLCYVSGVINIIYSRYTE